MLRSLRARLSHPRLHAAQDDKFASSFISTIGIDFKIKSLELDGQRVRCQIVRGAPAACWEKVDGAAA